MYIDIIPHLYHVNQMLNLLSVLRIGLMINYTAMDYWWNRSAVKPGYNWSNFCFMSGISGNPSYSGPSNGIMHYSGVIISCIIVYYKIDEYMILIKYQIYLSAYINGGD